MTASGFLNALEKPYFQVLGKGKVVAIVESSSPVNAELFYWKGGDQPYSQSTSFYRETLIEGKKLFFHRIFLDSLEPGRSYSYILKQKGTVINGTYKTPPGDSAVLKFAVLSDTQSNPEIHTKLIKQIMKYKPDLILYLGDLTYSGKANDIRTTFLSKEARKVFSEIPFITAFGNHDISGGDFSVFFEVPQNGDSLTYYSLDIGRNHFLVLNTQKSLKPDSRQYSFAKEDLASTMQKWRFVLMHKPIADENGVPLNRDMLRLADSVFIWHKVDFILSGHIHLYSRSIFKGVESFILGGGGGTLKKEAKTKENENADKPDNPISTYHFAIFETDVYTTYVRIFDSEGLMIYNDEVTPYF